MIVLCLIVAFPAIPDAKTPRGHKAKREFRKENPCPSTGRKSGSCPGYHVDHIKPLKDDGDDHKSNMQWLSEENHKEKTKRERKDTF